MAKPEWGQKRLCASCGTRYYDMRHDPIVCPKCGATFDAEAVVKTKRVRAQAVVSEPVIGPIVAEDIDTELVAGMENVDIGAGSPAIQGEGQVPAAVVATGDEGDDGDADVGDESEGEAEAEEEEVPEDASELGEDEDDMAEVIENVDEEEER